MKKLILFSLALFATATLLAQSGGTNPALIMYRYNSSATLSPLPVLNGDLLGTLRWNGLVTYGNIGTGATIQSYVTGFAGTNLRANMIFQTSGSLPDGTGLTQLRDRVIITENGRVGIGTMTPLFNLHVEGNTHTTGRFHGRIHFDVGAATGLPNTYNDEAYFERKTRAALGLAANTYSDGGILSLAPGGNSLDRQLFSGGDDGFWTRSQALNGSNAWADWEKILTSGDIIGRANMLARYMPPGPTSSTLRDGQVLDNGTNVVIGGFLPYPDPTIPPFDVADVLTVKGRARMDGNTHVNGNMGVGIAPTANRLEVSGNSRLNGNANVTGSLDVDVNANVDGNLQVGSNGRVDGTLVVGNPPTTPGSHRLYVNGSIIATEVRVALQSNWSDYVFEQGYDLKPLEEVEKYVQENKHLPGVVSAKEVADNGLDLGEMQRMQMEKIEELFLHLIQQQKQIEQQQKTIERLESELANLKK